MSWLATVRGDDDDEGLLVARFLSRPETDEEVGSAVVEDGRGFGGRNVVVL